MEKEAQQALCSDVIEAVINVIRDNAKKDTADIEATISKTVRAQFDYADIHAERNAEIEKFINERNKQIIWTPQPDGASTFFEKYDDYGFGTWFITIIDQNGARSPLDSEKYGIAIQPFKSSLGILFAITIGKWLKPPYGTIAIYRDEFTANQVAEALIKAGRDGKEFYQMPATDLTALEVLTIVNPLNAELADE